ncbi:hypothetical protein HJ122_24245 [Vibrio parahaemolyticus]|nr:hypothetical protein [Vibrio parahaemolyticus]
MKYYLDTNVLYNLKKASPSVVDKSFTSCLSIFELISGIDSSEKFIRRKRALEAVAKSNINIVWELPKNRIERSFGLAVDNSDAKATRFFFEQLINVDSFEEAKELATVYDGKCYKLDTLKNYDDWFCEEMLDLLNNKSTKFEKIEDDDKGHLKNFVASIIVEQFICGMGSEYVRPSDKYFEVLKYYFNNGVIKEYVNFLAIYIVDKVSKGKTAGKNDAFDIGHLSYMDGVDIFVSSDSMYKELLEKHTHIINYDVDKYLSIET